MALDRVRAGFAGADPDGLLNVRYKYLAIADAARLGRAADRFEPGTNMRAWLFTILHNTARNRARDRARDTVAVDSETVDRAADAPPPGSLMPAVETPESLLIRETLGPELQAAIDALPDAFRQAVWLRDVEEFSYAEIARMLEIPLGTVKSRLSVGIHRLRDVLAPIQEGVE